MPAYYKVGDFLKDINVAKKNILRQDPDAHKDYTPYIVNMILSSHLDAILHVNQLNIREFASKQMQYDYLINALKKRSRFAEKLQISDNLNIKPIMEYYGYSKEKAEAVEKLLSVEQIESIKMKLDKGGR